MAWKHVKGKKHPHKGSHAPRRKGWHISAAARAARIGKKHPHRGYHGHRTFKGRHYHGRHYHGRKSKGRKPRHVAHRHISAAADARRRGKKHPHRGHGKGRVRVRKPRHVARRASPTKRTTRHGTRRPGQHRATKRRPSTHRRVGTVHARHGRRHGSYKFRSRFVGHRHHLFPSRPTRRKRGFKSKFTRRR